MKFYIRLIYLIPFKFINYCIVYKNGNVFIDVASNMRSKLEYKEINI